MQLQSLQFPKQHFENVAVKGASRGSQEVRGGVRGLSGGPGGYSQVSGLSNGSDGVSWSVTDKGCQ